MDSDSSGHPGSIACQDCLDLKAEVERLQCCLRVAAGELSTYGNHTTKHPQEVYEYLLDGGNMVYKTEVPA